MSETPVVDSDILRDQVREKYRAVAGALFDGANVDDHGSVELFTSLNINRTSEPVVTLARAFRAVAVRRDRPIRFARARPSNHGQDPATDGLRAPRLTVCRP